MIDSPARDRVRWVYERVLDTTVLAPCHYCADSSFKWHHQRYFGLISVQEEVEMHHPSYVNGKSTANLKESAFSLVTVTDIISLNQWWVSILNRSQIHNCFLTGLCSMQEV